MKLFPLVFSFRDIVAGNGYVAAVAMDGRALLCEEDDGDIWLFGVQPGGISGGDRHQRAAFAEFKNNYMTVLYDIAAEATSFEEFNAKVTALFREVNEPNLADWEQALVDVRANKISLDDLKTVKAESRMPNLHIEKVAPEMTASTYNELGQIAEAA